MKTPSRRANPRLSNPVTMGGGCLVAVLAIFLALSIFFWTEMATEAQLEQPTMYIVGEYRSKEMGESYAIYWFKDTNEDECYVKVGYNKSGGGMSCHWK